jgi:hypothetical protein
MPPQLQLLPPGLLNKPAPDCPALLQLMLRPLQTQLNMCARLRQLQRTNTRAGCDPCIAAGLLSRQFLSLV